MNERLRRFVGLPRPLKLFVNFHFSNPTTLYTVNSRGSLWASPLPHATKRWCFSKKNQVLPKIIREERVAVAQLRNKVPIGYNVTPQIYGIPQNCPFPSTITTPI